MESTRLLTLLLDVDRLAVAGSIAAHPRSTDELIDATGLDRKAVLSAIGDLRSVGLVTVDDAGVYSLDDTAMRVAAQQAAEIEIPMDPVIGYGMSDDERAVLERSFSGRILNEIPVQHAKRLIVLQRIALEFDVGHRYTEFEINELLGAFHPDWSALRRGLVDEGLLDREPTAGGNIYWRSGGRVTDLPPG